MPIYAYRCSACGHAQDVLQKISDDVLTVCPACGAASFVKQVTAAGFQLKGSGWYVTDFRGGNTAGKEAAKDGAAEGAKDAPTPAAADAGKGAAAADKSPAAAPAKAAEAAKPAAAAPPPAAPKAGA
jgi:putative FmdB family regulatory protein